MPGNTFLERALAGVLRGDTSLGPEGQRGARCSNGTSGRAGSAAPLFPLPHAASCCALCAGTSAAVADHVELQLQRTLPGLLASPRHSALSPTPSPPHLHMLWPPSPPLSLPASHRWAAWLTLPPERSRRRRCLWSSSPASAPRPRYLRRGGGPGGALGCWPKYTVSGLVFRAIVPAKPWSVGRWPNVTPLALPAGCVPPL